MNKPSHISGEAAAANIECFTSVFGKLKRSPMLLYTVFAVKAGTLPKVRNLVVRFANFYRFHFRPLLSQAKGAIKYEFALGNTKRHNLRR